MLKEKQRVFLIRWLGVLTFCFPLYCYAEKSYVICTANNCPGIAPILNPNEKLDKQVIIYQTTYNLSFMIRSTQSFSSMHNGGWQSILINESKYQKVHPIIGFGGAFTDSAAILYQNLSFVMKKALLDAYFSQNGIGYSLGRVPIASSDFSCRQEGYKHLSLPSLGPCSYQLSPYTYADKPDDSLRHFSLQYEDLRLKIPFIRAAMQMTEKEHQQFKLYASPWSAPYWMKTNGQMIHGSLRTDQYQTWANYFVKFFRAYKAHHIHFWGLTIQNEPVPNDNNSLQKWQTMFFSMEEEANFVKNYLGPTLHQFEKEYGSHLNLIIHDDQILSIEHRSKMINDLDLAKYVNGAGIHWYTNSFFSHQILDKVYENLNQSASRFILGTEACNGYLPLDKGPRLGNWLRGENYAHDIISDLNHFVSGWTDWNLMLDMKGGPNWANNFVDAPVLVDLKEQTIYKQPMYYYMGHFSKFIRPESQLLASKSVGIFPLEQISFKVPAHNNLPETIVVVVLNRDITGRKYYIQDDSIPNESKYLNISIPARSIQTIIYKANIPLKLGKGVA